MSAVFDPPLTIASDLCIAVTGNCVCMSAHKLRSSLQDQFSELFAHLDRCTVGQCTVVTGMRDGAEIAAIRALPEGWQAEGVLSEPVADWEKYLAITMNESGIAQIVSTGTIETIKGDFLGCQVAVEVGWRILTGADCLVAVWDGKPGEPGGPGDVVAMAEAMGLPIYIIHLP